MLPQIPKMNHKNTAPTLLLAAIAGFAVARASVNAGEISISTTAPTVDGYDIANYAAPTATQKWFHDIEHDAGQTFTPTEDGLLNSFTVYLASKNLNDAGSENVDLRLGIISRPGGVFTFTDVYSENAVMAASPEGDWAAEDYITFTFDTPQAVSAGVEYGIITDAQSMGSWRNGGIPYRHRTGNDYAGGVLINRGRESARSDLVFHIDIGPDVAAAPFAITEIDYGSDLNTVTLTWRNSGADSYSAKFSLDMTNWDSDLDDGITAESDENPEDTDHITVTFPLEGVLGDAEELFFRIEGS